MKLGVAKMVVSYNPHLHFIALSARDIAMKSVTILFGQRACRVSTTTTATLIGCIIMKYQIRTYWQQQLLHMKPKWLLRIQRTSKSNKRVSDCNALFYFFFNFLFITSLFYLFFIFYILLQPFAVNLAVQEPNHFWFLAGSARNHITGCVVIQIWMLADHVPLCGNCIIIHLVKMKHLIKAYLKKEWLELMPNQETEF